MKFIFAREDFERISIDYLLAGIHIPIIEAKNFANLADTINQFLEDGEPNWLELEFTSTAVKADGVSSERTLGEVWHMGGEP